MTICDYQTEQTGFNKKKAYHGSLIITLFGYCFFSISAKTNEIDIGPQHNINFYVEPMSIFMLNNKRYRLNVNIDIGST